MHHKKKDQKRFELLCERMRLAGWYEWHPAVRHRKMGGERRMLKSSRAQSRFHARISRRSAGMYGGIARRRRKAGGLYARRMQSRFIGMGV